MEIDPEIIAGKDKTLDRIGVEMTTEGIGICKISVGLIAEIEAGEVLTEAIVMIGVGHEKEACPPGSMTIITVRMATLDLDQGLGVDPAQE